jgi:hypothetical protein
MSARASGGHAVLAGARAILRTEDHNSGWRKVGNCGCIGDWEREREGYAGTA